MEILKSPCEQSTTDQSLSWRRSSRGILTALPNINDIFAKSSIVDVWQDPKYTSDDPLSTNLIKWSNTQTIRRQFADELFECVWPFCRSRWKSMWCLNSLLLVKFNFNFSFNFDVNMFKVGTVQTTTTVLLEYFCWSNMVNKQLRLKSFKR